MSYRFSPSLGIAALSLLASSLFISPALAFDDDAPRDRSGFVFSTSNATTGNELLVYRRSAFGAIALVDRVSTGGTGTGSGLGSQGALAFGRSHDFLYAVNAASDQISVFNIAHGRARLTQTLPSGGHRPISITSSGRVVYVLNAGGGNGAVDSITGFLADRYGRLTPIPGSARPLSAASTGPAEIAFSPDNRFVVVTEKTTNKIDVFFALPFGQLVGPVVQSSVGNTPFGFDFSRDGHLIVSEAFGGATDASTVSSYDLVNGGWLSVNTPSAPTTETAACWIATTQDGRFAYATNTGSGSVTGYAVNRRTGELSILNADGVTGVTGPNSTPIDDYVADNRFLYVLSRGKPGIDAFRIANNGSLTFLGTASGPLAAAAGLLAD